MSDPYKSQQAATRRRGWTLRKDPHVEGAFELIEWHSRAVVRPNSGLVRQSLARARVRQTNFGNEGHMTICERCPPFLEDPISRLAATYIKFR